ncbi:hypothetical protein A9Z40_12805 [Microbacterium arborescens]|uniref:Uncharacterized protein n=1 Tax=Microbacterium arborescens TaxID=33883 RepID=A0ABX2WLF6_9MICO|nr:hypothetical protein A9Z40_12805 [Microbacterium arborescens]
MIQGSRDAIEHIRSHIQLCDIDSTTGGRETRQAEPGGGLQRVRYEVIDGLRYLTYSGQIRARHGHHLAEPPDTSISLIPRFGCELLEPSDGGLRTLNVTR